MIDPARRGVPRGRRADCRRADRPAKDVSFVEHLPDRHQCPVGDARDAGHRGAATGGGPAPGLDITESLVVTSEGAPLPVRRLTDPDGNLLDVVAAPAGPLSVSYEAHVRRQSPGPRPAGDLEQIVALRPSRYCPSDGVVDRAREQFGTPSVSARGRARGLRLRPQHDRLRARRQRPTDECHRHPWSRGQGVCRDFAHVVVSLCRALDIPARVAAVYAPGLSPMDFHMVAETAVDGSWYVWDATRLAPRTSLVRIATGRDAADVSFCTDIGAALTLNWVAVSAINDRDLDRDDHTSLVSLP